MNWFLKVFKQYADFNGRARRKEFWMFILFNMIIIYGLMAIMAATGWMFISIILFVYYIAMIIPMIAVNCRRMHDVGKSGWYQLIPIYSFILAVTNGAKGANEYGPDPKGNDEVDQIGVKQED